MSFEDKLTPVQLVEFNELDCKRYAARRKELAAMRKMEEENKPDFAKILKTAMEALGAAVVVFIVLAIMFVASVAGKTNETREIGGTAYDWGNTVVTDDGNEWSVIDAPELPSVCNVAYERSSLRLLVRALRISIYALTIVCTNMLVSISTKLVCV